MQIPLRLYCESRSGNFHRASDINCYNCFYLFATIIDRIRLYSRAILSFTTGKNTNSLTFRSIIFRLEKFWKGQRSMRWKVETKKGNFVGNCLREANNNNNFRDKRIERRDLSKFTLFDRNTVYSDFNSLFPFFLLLPPLLVLSRYSKPRNSNICFHLVATIGTN